MFTDCNLVHGDLSEFNILYHENNVHIIDVSQVCLLIKLSSEFEVNFDELDLPYQISNNFFFYRNNW